MEQDHIQKLLGGYATGTLTPEEQQALFEAALTDQQLFDALAGEQSLRDLLRDPAARAQLLASIDDRPLPWYRRFWRPLTVAAAAAALTGAGVYFTREKAANPAPVLVARNEPLPPPPNVVLEQRDAVPPASAPVPPKPEPKIKAKPAGAPVERREVALQPAAPAPTSSSAPPAPVPAAAGPPPPPPVETALKKELAAGAAGAPVVVADKPAEPMKADTNESIVLAGGTSGGVPSAFFDGRSKPISLQSAQSMFYSTPPQDAVMVTSQNAVQLEQQKQTAPTQQRDDKDFAQQQRQFKGTIQGLAAKTAARAVNLGVKWTVLRRNGRGDFVEVDPNQLRAGDTVKLRLMPNDDGYISVWEGTTALQQPARVTRLNAFETPAISGTQAGQRNLLVQFTRTAPTQDAVFRSVPEQQSATDSKDHSTYVINASTSSVLPVSVKISLSFK
jgi:hypothetical protein